jgi:hypothetical protein
MTSQSIDTNLSIEVSSICSDCSEYDENVLKSCGFQEESINNKHDKDFSIHMTKKEFDKLEKNDQQKFFEYVISEKTTKNFFCSYNSKACLYKDFIHVQNNNSEFCYFNGISEKKNVLWFYYHSLNGNIYEISYMWDLYNKLHVWGFNNFI